VNASRVVAVLIALLGVAFAAYVEYGTPRAADVERSFGWFAFEAGPFIVAGVVAVVSHYGRALCFVGLAMLAVEVYAYCVVFVGSTVDDAALIYLRKPFLDLAIIATGMLAGFLVARAREPSR
jgi:hypothetical protein